MFRTSIMLSALLVSTSLWADVTKEEAYSFPIESDGRFSLDNINGDIEVVGGAGDTIELIAIKTADNQKDLDRIKLLISDDRDHVRIEVKYEDDDKWFGWNSNSGSVSFQASVPAGVSLNSVETVNGDVRVEGVDGEIKVDTVNGDIDVRGIVGDVNLDTVNGGIEASFVRLEGSQRAIMDTVNGAIEVTLPGNASAAVSADTVNGSIRAGDFNLEVDDSGWVGTELQGDIGSGDARLKMDTVNGAIRVRRQ